ncbi:MAG: nucleoside monophosphate kinase [Candidatus Doudnabacteria bacterium]|nr:nucleoside monophosphate kinase [Candidatus Doudnabacteria bacterium]
MKIKNFLILIGPPGSGKGTQGKLLAPILNYNYLSLGQTLRDYAKGKEDEAKQVKKLINAGKIIPDAMISVISHSAIKILPKAEGLILDGFPRDIDQTNILDELISKYKVERVKAVFIDVPKAKVLERLLHRKDSRTDDNAEVIETRFKEYDEKTHPILEYFDRQHKLIKIHGDQSIEQVHAEILKKLEHGHKIRI